MVISTSGTKRDNFRAIARLWNAYLGDRCVGLSSEDVALMMMLLKVARSQTGAAAEPDHYVDMCGYAAIAGELVTAI